MNFFFHVSSLEIQKLLYSVFLFLCKVRTLGSILNVPDSFLKRHPFPGPGLAVRVLGDVTEGNALEILRQVILHIRSTKSSIAAIRRLNFSI